MDKAQLEALTAAFVQNGGKVKQCADGDTAVRVVPAGLWACQCGCLGDYTDHSMRAGESGRCSSVIVR